MAGFGLGSQDSECRGRCCLSGKGALEVLAGATQPLHRPLVFRHVEFRLALKSLSIVEVSGSGS